MYTFLDNKKISAFKKKNKVTTSNVSLFLMSYSEYHHNFNFKNQIQITILNFYSYRSNSRIFSLSNSKHNTFSKRPPREPIPNCPTCTAKHRIYPSPTKQQWQTLLLRIHNSHVAGIKLLRVWLSLTRDAKRTHSELFLSIILSLYLSLSLGLALRASRRLCPPPFTVY